MKSASEGECLIAQRMVCFADGLKVKTWWEAAAELVSENVTVMCDFNLINCSFSLNKFAESINLCNFRIYKFGHTKSEIVIHFI